MQKRMSRRSAMAMAAAVSVLPAVPVAAAPRAPEAEQNAGWYRFGLGDFEITVVSDGNLRTPAGNLGTNVDPAEVEAFLQEHYMDPQWNYAHTNHVIVDTGEAKVLIDVGSGDRFQPTAGRLVENMEAAGLAPEDITHIALTHAHPDHVWGMLDEFGDELRFPEASYAIGAAEFDWWMAPDRIDTVPEVMQPFVVGARTSLEPIAGKTAMAADGHQLAPGVTMIATPGHTAGHMSVLVESGGDQLLVLGDAVSHPYASFERPEWQFGFDTDPVMGAATRRRLLDRAAADRLTIAGYHLPFPGVGFVQATGDAFRYIPAGWIWNG